MEEDRRTIQHSLPSPHPYPWLFYYWNDKGGGHAQNFCTVSHPTKTYSTSFPELGGAMLWMVQHGWFLLRVYHPGNVAKLFLWNPSTFTKIELPLLELNGIRDIILISSPTTTDQICSVFIFSDSPLTSIFYWCLGDKQWTEVDYYEQLMSALANEGEGFSEGVIKLTDPFFYNGCLYAEMFKPCLLVEIKKLEPSGLKISSSHIFFPEIPYVFFRHISRMLESNNELFRIQILHAHHKVSAVIIHKLDFPRKVWQKVENIKDKVFFISDIDSSFVCQVINPETEGGRVFISLNKNNFVYIYNIEDKSLMVSQPFLNLPEKWSHTCWLMPDLRIIDPIKEDGKTQIRETGSSYEIGSNKRKLGKMINEFIFQKQKKGRDTVTDDDFSLPQDIVEAIANRINIGIDYLHFRATNRLFHLSTPPIQWRSSSAISMSRFDRLSSSPLFVYFEKDNVLTFVQPKNGLKYKYNINLTMDIQQYCEICYSKDGWLLMTLDKSSSFFLNPFAKEQQKPLANGSALNTGCIAFSHPPTSSECVVVNFVKIPQWPRMDVRITCPSWNEWAEFSFEGYDFSLYNISPAFHKGAFYYLNKKGKVAVLKVEKEKEEDPVALDELDKLDTPCTNYSNSFLVECNDNLLSVFEGPFGKWVRVFKLNESTMTWIQVENLENHMLFVGHTSLSAVAHIPGMENKIYFPRFYDKNIVFYSLETNNYHTFESDEVVNFHCMEEKVNSSWIEPRWH